MKYRKQVRKLNYNGEVKTKYNAKIVYGDVVNLKQLAEEISLDTALNSADVYSAIKALEQKFMKHLSIGNILDLGELGRFKASFKSKVCDSLKDVTPKTVTNYTVLYKPGKEIKEKLSQTKLELERNLDEHGNIVKYSHSKRD